MLKAGQWAKGLQGAILFPNLSSKTAVITQSIGCQPTVEWESDPELANVKGRECLPGDPGMPALRKDTEIESSILHLDSATCGCQSCSQSNTKGLVVLDSLS